MKREATLFERSLLIIVPFTAIFAVVLYIITSNSNGQVKSFLLSVIVSIIFYYWHYSNVDKIKNEEENKLNRFIIISTIFRLTICVTMVILSIFLEGFDPIFMAFGFLEYPAIIMVSSFVNKK